MSMDEHCYLQVDVNGDEVFMVDKSIISSYSGKINKLLSRSRHTTRQMKIIFHDFPGGPPIFELVTRFCYGNGKKLDVNPANIASLIYATHYMEMNKVSTGPHNLCEQMEKSLQETKYWTWPELLMALKHSQKLLPRASSVLLAIVDKLLNSLVSRIVQSWETNPSPPVTSSPQSSGVRASCETKSSGSLRGEFHLITWWFEDLTTFGIHLIEKMVRIMVSENFDNRVISKFLFYYQKSRSEPGSGLAEKVEIMEGVVYMLDSLDIKCVSHRSLFELLRAGLNIDPSQKCRETLESMIGSLLDQATLDDLLLPSPPHKSYLYDTDTVLRFFKSFIAKQVCEAESHRVEKIASLLDSYLVEIAPDPHLKPMKFLAVMRALPDSARVSFDRVHHAVNLYFEVHTSLSEEQKVKICCGLNYEKLSTEALDHLINNVIFPPESTSRAFFSWQHKLRSPVQDTEGAGRVSYYSQTAKEGRESKSSRQIVLYTQNLVFSYENEKLQAYLQGMQWRVLELEKVCRKMQSQMEKMKSKRSKDASRASLPKLCS